LINSLYLQEYLRANPQLFGTLHSTMAETCLSYLNSHQVKALAATPSPNLQSTPFVEYSSLYWGTHAKRDLSDCAELLALNLLGDYNNHISAKTLLKARARYVCPNVLDRPYVSSGLHCASMFGVDKIVAGFVEAEGCDINQRDCLGNTPLLWAANSGHEGVVKILLGRDDVNPDKPATWGLTPLSFAVRNGHGGVVQILLGRDDVNPSIPGRLELTPLFCALGSGHEGVAKILLGRKDVDPEKPCGFGLTPVYWAAQSGQEGVVKILLGRDDVNPNKPDNQGRTPLSRAIHRGHEGVIALLQPLAATTPGTI